MKPIKEIILCLILITALSSASICNVTEKDWLFKEAYSGYIEGVRTYLKDGWSVNSRRNGVSLIENAGMGDQVEMMRFLISKGARPSIHAAAGCGDMKLLKKLINQGYNVNAKNGNGDTPLIFAARNAHTNAARFLLDKGAQINAQNAQGVTALYAASGSQRSYPRGNDYGPMLKLLLNRGADPTICTAELRFSPLRSAVIAENLPLISSLIEDGADINVQDSQGVTPLLELCNEPNSNRFSRREKTEPRGISAIRLLLKNKANPNIASNDGLTPLTARVFWCDYATADLLLKYGAKEDLFSASGLGHYKKVLELIERGANVNAKSFSGYTPLHFAAQGGHADVVALLIAKGAKLESQSRFGCTPLHLAALSDSREVAALLIDKGAYVDAHAINGPTPLYFAAQENSFATAALLLSRGANVNAASYGDAPLHRAAANDSLGVALLLLIKGANANAKSIRILNPETDNVALRYTPLHFAAEKGHFLMSVLLVLRGADTNARLCDREDMQKKHGLENTAAELAAVHGHKWLAWYLAHPFFWGVMSIALVGVICRATFLRTRALVRRLRARRVGPDSEPAVEKS